MPNSIVHKIGFGIFCIKAYNLVYDIVCRRVFVCMRGRDGILGNQTFFLIALQVIVCTIKIIFVLNHFFSFTD